MTVDHRERHIAAYKCQARCNSSFNACVSAFALCHFSLGCLLYEMTCLKSPFYHPNCNFWTLGNKIKNGEYDPIPTCYSSMLSSLIQAMISPNPDARPDITAVYTHARSALDYLARNNGTAAQQSVTQQNGSSTQQANSSQSAQSQSHAQSQYSHSPSPSSLSPNSLYDSTPSHSSSHSPASTRPGSSQSSILAASNARRMLHKQQTATHSSSSMAD